MKKLAKVMVASVLGLGLFVGSGVVESNQVEAKSYATDLNLASKGLAQYIPKKGENAVSVARKTGTHLSQVRSMNGLKGNSVKAGKALLVSSTIQSGASMWVKVSSVNTKSKTVKLQRFDGKGSFNAKFSANKQKTLVNVSKSGNKNATVILSYNAKSKSYTITSLKRGLN